MRIVEVRRFLGDFVVFVNSKRDMKILEKDKRFSLYAFYRDMTNNFYGKEYIFTCASRHNKAAKCLIRKILKESK